VSVVRSALAAILAAAVVATPCAVGAQQPATKVYRVGILARGQSPALQTFRDRLRELGYVTGRNIAFEERYDDGHPDRLPGMASDLVRRHVDVILAVSSTYVRPARQATSTIPIVFAFHNDPVGTGDVVTLAHPGRNVTGVTQSMTELNVKQLQLLREAVPGLSRIAVVWNPDTPSHGPALRQTDETARALGLHLSKVEARGGDEYDRAFAAAAREHTGAALVLMSPNALLARDRIVALAARHKLPAIYGLRAFVEGGGLMAYGVNELPQFRRAAEYVDKILRGAKPADLPVEQSNTFEFVINLKTAKALGLALSPSLLTRADHIIE